MLRSLVALLMLALPAVAQPGREQVLAVQEGARIIMREARHGGHTLIVANPGQPRQAAAADQRFALVSRTVLGGQRVAVVRGWTGGAYCCFTLHILAETARGWRIALSHDLGKHEGFSPQQSDGVLWLPNGNLDFWDADASRSADLRVPIAYSWQQGRLRPDAALMRRPVEEALGEACLARGRTADHTETSGRRPPSTQSLPAMVDVLNAGEWGQPAGGNRWRPEVEFARRALCLLHAGYGEAATSLMAAWPDHRPQRDETMRQIRARLLCQSQALTALRALNPGHAWLAGKCMAQDTTALSSLD